MLGATNFDLDVDDLDVQKHRNGYQVYDGEEYLCYVEKSEGSGICFAWNGNGVMLDNAGLIFAFCELIYFHEYHQ